jgi:2-polyprenyl-3-methyl-5-hydroxy-6-metoxy-1,4-benzoquinol methylase
MKNEENIICLDFELKTISGIINYGQLERWVPGYCNKNTENEHVERYLWVSNFVNNKDVLDIACGVGRGSYMLAEIGKAKKVLGCDIDKEVIQYASIKNKHESVSFKINDAEKINIDDKFDVIISFETIEHLNNTDNFLNSIKNKLNTNGYFFVSTPISKLEIDNNPHNTFHKKEWGFLKFQKIIEEYFDIKNIYLQLYPKKLNILEKIFNKLFYKNKKYINHNMEPILWDKNVLSHKQISRRNGYQIIQCQQKIINIHS